jgi:ribosomal protein L11 methyltransferase
MLDALPDWEDKPRTILDIGSGSGILAIVAAKLCDAEITAIDIDCAALESAKENAALNGRADRIAFICRSVEEQDSLFDLVIANLDYRTFMALGASTARLTAARLIVAGLTCAQWPEIRDMFASLGLRPVSEAQLGDWKSGMFHRIA